MAASKGLKIAVSGKGGVGKTTLSALLCHLYDQENKNLLAVDADPDANLGMALGFTSDELQQVTTIGDKTSLCKNALTFP